MSNETKIQSMTGFGRGIAEGDGVRAAVELRSVNGRFLDMRVRMPKPWAVLEGKVREKIAHSFARGTVDVFVTCDRVGGTASVKVNKDLATAYAQEVRVLAREIGLESHAAALSVMKLPGVIQENPLSSDDDAVTGKVLEALDMALAEAVRLRETEGARTLEALRREMAALEGCLAKVLGEREELNADVAERFSTRLKKLLGESGAELDHARLVQEAAIYLERGDVTEELDRLRNHIDQFKQDLKGARPLGKRLDFLVQEMFREVNTLGSKSSKITVIREVMEMKLALDRIKEQVQNLE